MPIIWLSLNLDFFIKPPVTNMPEITENSPFKTYTFGGGKTTKIQLFKCTNLVEYYINSDILYVTKNKTPVLEFIFLIRL